MTLVALPLTACGDFSDPPPDPAEAPLEIVANNAASGTCALNRTEVGAGSHEVVVVAEGADVVVVLRDTAGRVVLRQQGDTFAQVPVEDEEAPGVSSEAAPVVPLDEGSYRVACRYAGGATGSATLTVTP